MGGECSLIARTLLKLDILNPVMSLLEQVVNQLVTTLLHLLLPVI